MLYNTVFLLSVALLLIVNGNPDVTTDCIYDCTIQLGHCEQKSAECQNFVTYFSNSNRSTSYSSASVFQSAATTYCQKYNATKNTYYSVCDNYTTALLSCMNQSTCWMSTTAYSTDCSYYAEVKMEIQASGASSQTLCKLRWNSLFDAYLGADYLTVNYSYLSGCTSTHRLLGTAESESSESSEISSENSESSSESSSGTVEIELLLIFYSEYAYSTFISYISSSTFLSSFISLGYTQNVHLSETCMETTCCPSAPTCTTNYDISCTQIGSSDAMSNKPFAVLNFMVIGIILYRYLF